MAAPLPPLAAALLLAGAAAAPRPPAKAEAPARSRLAPLPPGPGARWIHSPYEAGDCSTCHARNDRKSPGPIVTKSVNELCATCHDEVQAMQRQKVRHPAAEDACTNCHNPHDAQRRKLLLADLPDLCVSCHDAVRKETERAAVKHGAVTDGERCVACHDPHGSANRKLLVKPAFDLCLSCHGRDGLKGWDERALANLGSLLSDNRTWHEPVRAKNCTGCHSPHGAANPSLLADAYPATFYAAYDAKAYGLCFQCHDEAAFSTPETTTLTNFRNGSRNLHYVHVHQKRGRTCRVCHEVHASKEDHLIRRSIPYGPRRWTLEVGYEGLPTGGSCVRTCHETRSYHYYRATNAVSGSP